MATYRRSQSRSGGRSGGRAPRKPDALRMLKEDHARVREMFDKFEHTRGESGKQQLAEQICSDLRLHAMLEESVFYPRVREAAEDAADLLNEAEVEHASAKDLIAQIESASPEDEKFDALVTVLREYVLHHVKDEEGELFKAVRGAGMDLAELAEEMEQWKSEAQGGREPRMREGDEAHPSAHA
jgi:hypothetical protein